MRRKNQSKLNKSKEARSPRSSSKEPLRLLRGMKDILPNEQKYWSFVQEKVDKLASIYGFGKISTPVLEITQLFKRAVGEETDIVAKEMFSFTDQGGDEICLRPEATASIVRAYIEHGMVNLPQPVKLWYFGPMFRHDRPQAGRLRQFNQFGFEVFGSQDPVVDAQLILLLYVLCRELKLDISIQINSIGCRVCRGEYRKVLVDYLRTKKSFLCEVCQERLGKNPLRILDCKEEECRSLVAEAPQIIDFLCDECRSHFVKVLEHLDEVEVPYNLNPYLVRGLDYYTKTVFEVWPVGVEPELEEGPVDENIVELENQAVKAVKNDKGNINFDANQENQDKENLVPANLSLGGGGRYDGLVELLGGRETPAVGFAGGVERLILQLKRQGIVPRNEAKVEVFLAQLGDRAKRRSLKLFEELRRRGIKAGENLAKEGLKPQLETANKLGVRYTLILGQKEILDNTIIVRDMESGVQEVIDFDRVAEEMKRRLK